MFQKFTQHKSRAFTRRLFVPQTKTCDVLKFPSIVWDENNVKIFNQLCNLFASFSPFKIALNICGDRCWVTSNVFILPPKHHGFMQTSIKRLAMRDSSIKRPQPQEISVCLQKFFPSPCSVIYCHSDGDNSSLSHSPRRPVNVVNPRKALKLFANEL